MKFSRPHLQAELEQSHPRAHEALLALDTWCRGQGWEELLLVEVMAGQAGWAAVGCRWAVRLRVYSREQRQALRRELARGRPRPEWEVEEVGDVLRCTLRDFPWRAERLGLEPGGSNGGTLAVQGSPDCRCG